MTTIVPTMCKAEKFKRKELHGVLWLHTADPNDYFRGELTAGSIGIVRHIKSVVEIPGCTQFYSSVVSSR